MTDKEEETSGLIDLRVKSDGSEGLKWPQP